MQRGILRWIDPYFMWTKYFNQNGNLAIFQHSGTGIHVKQVRNWLASSSGTIAFHMFLPLPDRCQEPSLLVNYFWASRGEGRIPYTEDRVGCTKRVQMRLRCQLAAINFRDGPEASAWGFPPRRRPSSGRSPLFSTLPVGLLFLSHLTPIKLTVGQETTM